MGTAAKKSDQEVSQRLELRCSGCNVASSCSRRIPFLPRPLENPPAVPSARESQQVGLGHLVASDPGSSSSTSSNAIQGAALAAGGGTAAAVSAAGVAPFQWSGGDDGRIPAHLMPHRKPKNFADRLMRVLLNGGAPDTLWWVADGKAVAVHARNLKRGNLLETHFKIKHYNAFIRNCNRW